MAEIGWQIVACVLAADLATGLVHWWEDAYGLPTWPWLGPAVIRPNIEHHLQPWTLGGMGGFAFRNWQSAALACAVCWGAWAMGWLTWQLVLTAALASLGNEVHLWAHHPRRGGPLVARLQELGVLQSPQQHGRHHRPPFEAYYCTLTNFVNPVLEAARFWRLLEMAIEATTGIAPRRGSAERSGV